MYSHSSYVLQVFKTAVYLVQSQVNIDVSEVVLLMSIPNICIMLLSGAKLVVHTTLCINVVVLFFNIDVVGP